jgi:siderophore synthetase component
MDYLVKPVIIHFDYLVRNKGILMQCHAQNTLLEINESFSPTRIIYRDFGSLTIDPEFRIKNGLNKDPMYR